MIYDYLERKYVKEKIMELFDFHFHETNTIQSCDHCNGTGFKYEEKLTDYHRREYNTYRSECKICEGEGRVVVNEIKFEARPRYGKKLQTHIPFSKFDGDPHKHHVIGGEIPMRVDMRVKHMEDEHPKLKKMSYNVYDQLTEELYTLDALKKETK